MGYSFFDLFRKKKKVDSKNINVDNVDKNFEVKKNTEVETVLSEKEILLQKIKKEDLDILKFRYNLGEDNITLEFVSLLINTPTLLSYLKDNFINAELVKKINNKSLSINDIDVASLGLLNFDIFSDEDKEIINILKNNKNNFDLCYTVFSMENFNSNLGELIELPSYIDSFFDDKKILTDVRYGIKLNEKFISFYNDDKFEVYSPIDVKKVFYQDIFYPYYSENLKINENCIVAISFDKFKEIIKNKNNLELLKEVQIILKDNFDEYVNFKNNIHLFNNNDFKDYIGIENNNIDTLRVKKNHLLEVIENSSLSEEIKNYYHYCVSNIYLNYYELRDLAREIMNKIEENEIVQISNNFDKQNLDYKMKEITPISLTVEIFLSQFENLSAISSFGFLDSFSRLNEDIRQEFLKSPIILNKLQGLIDDCSKDEYRYYKKITENLTIEEIFKIFDGKFIAEFYGKHRDCNEYRFFYTILEKDINKVVEFILHDDIYFREFIKDIRKYSFSELDYDNLIQLLKKMEKFDNGVDLGFLDSIDKKKQFNLLKEDFNGDFLVNIVKNSFSEVQQFFYLEDKRFSYLYNKFNLLGINKNKFRIPDDILHKDDFFDNFKSSSLIKFRVNINNFLSNQPSLYLKEKSEEYVNDLINNFDVNNGMFRQYQDLINNISLLDNRDFLYNSKDFLYNSHINHEIRSKKYISYDYNDNIVISSRERLESYLKEVSRAKLSELVIDSLFEDNIYNVFINIKELVRFDSRLNEKEKVLSGEQLEFYKMILKLDKIDGKEIIEIYNKFKNLNVNLMFYEDLQKMKYMAYDKIKQEMIQPENMKGLEDRELSKKYGVDVFDCRDKEYVILARCLSNRINQKWHNRRDCYTLLSNENSSVFHDDDYIYGYSGFDNDCVLHMFEGDSFSADDVEINDLSAGSNRVNRIMTSHEIATNSYWYSEIQIVNKKKDNDTSLFETLRPSFLVVYDMVNDKVLEEARKKNLPIFIISHTKVNSSFLDKIPFDEDLDKYVESYISDYEEEKRNKYR